MGDRPSELDGAVRSALGQHGVDVEVIVVANGGDQGGIGIAGDDRVRVVRSSTNLGIPGGRNYGLGHTHAPIVAFLDDDARYLDDEVLTRGAAMLGRRPTWGAIALRVTDEAGVTAGRHVPRIGARHPDRSGLVTAFVGGAVAMRRDAFVDAGGYAESFVYSMEETDLALRLADRNWQIFYDGRPAVFHHASAPTRHPGAVTHTMRNRVWLAHRNLPALLAVAYVADWIMISAVRNRHEAQALLAAVRQGWRSRPGPRDPIRWRTVARLTRLGRPPVV